MTEILGIPTWLRPQLDAYWAAMLACPTSMLYANQPVIVESTASPGILGIQVENHWIFTVHPDSVGCGARSLVAELLSLPSITSSVIPNVAGPASVQVQTILGQGGFHNVYGPADLLYCTALTFRPLAATGPSSPVIIDQLQDLDPARVDCFRQQMRTIAWRLDQPQLWPRICGIFDEGQLVATGAIRLWGDAIGEIFVDTLPTYRNLGYAKALAGRLTEWLLRETNWIPQYDAEVENIHSLRIAHRLGFQRYGVMLVASEA